MKASLCFNQHVLYKRKSTLNNNNKQHAELSFPPLVLEMLYISKLILYVNRIMYVYKEILYIKLIYTAMSYNTV